MERIDLYRGKGLDIYEEAHYGRGEHLAEVAQILSWYPLKSGRLLDLGCSGGLHALEFARHGFRVTGVDAEPSAIERARQRSLQEGVAVDLRVLELGRDPLAPLGRFDLIYGIGNVLAHLHKTEFAEVLKEIRGMLSPAGVFLCDLIMIGEEFPPEVREDGLGIVWHRSLDRATGRIRLTGDFSKAGVRQAFQVWGYTRDEAVTIFSRAGFEEIEYATGLDFGDRGAVSGNPVCLRFRCR